MHNLLLINGNTSCQHIHGPLQVLLLQNVSNTDFIDALTGGFIERSTGSKHDGITMVVKLLQQPALELIRIVNRQTGHDIERAHGFLHHNTGNLPQLIYNGVTALPVFLLACPEEFVVHTVQSSSTDLVHGGNSQTGLAELQQSCLELLVAGHHTANTGTTGREPLGDGVDDNQVLIDVPIMGHGGNTKLVIIAEFPVHFVTDQEQIVLLGNVCNHPHFLLVQHNTGGIAGVGDHNGAGIGRNQTLDALAVCIAVSFPGVGGQRTDNTTRRMNEGGIVGIVRLGNDDLSIGIQNGQAGKQQRLRTAGGNEDVIVLQVHVQLLVVILNSFDHHGHTGRCLIFQSAVCKLVHGLIKSRRRGQVRLTNVQMVDLFTLFLGSHGQRVELSHRRGFAAVCVDGNLHKYLH